MKLPYGIFFVVFCMSLLAEDAPTFFKKKIKDLAPEYGIWGVCVEDAKNGATLLSYHADRQFIPASNMKLWTTIVALEKLGPDFRFVTTMYTNGTIEDGVLRGDLILYGQGDPTFTEFELQKMVVQLKELGINKISGKIVVSECYFDGDRIQEQWEVMDIPLDYGCEISAMSLNKNVTTISLHPGAFEGAQAEVRVDDAVDAQIINNTYTISGRKSDIRVKRAFDSNTFVLSGTIGINASVVEKVRAVHNVPRWIAQRSLKILRDAEIDCSGKVSVETCIPSELQLLTTIYSAPLKDIILYQNKESLNLDAELLLRAVGKISQKNDKSVMKNALDELGDIAQKIGLKKKSFLFSDGSGLSHHNFISPKAMVVLLQFGRRQPYKKILVESLPIAAVDGTLKKRFCGTRGENCVAAKTGLLGSASTLCGFARAASGRKIVFSLMVNNHIWRPETHIDAFLEDILAMF